LASTPDFLIKSTLIFWQLANVMAADLEVIDDRFELELYTRNYTTVPKTIFLLIPPEILRGIGV